MNEDPETRDPETRDREETEPAREDERVVVTGPLVVLALLTLLLGVAAGIISATKAAAP